MTDLTHIDKTVSYLLFIHYQDTQLIASALYTTLTRQGTLLSTHSSHHKQLTDHKRCSMLGQIRSTLLQGLCLGYLISFLEHIKKMLTSLKYLQNKTSNKLCACEILVFTAVRILVMFLVLAPCSLVNRCRRFGES
jgi:hypothetical protein